MTGSDPYLPGHGDDRYQVEHYALDLRYKPLGNYLFMLVNRFFSMNKYQ